MLRETRGKPSVHQPMGKPGDCTYRTSHKTFEEQESALINESERAENRKKESGKNLSKESKSWSDYIPRSQEEKKLIIQELTLWSRRARYVIRHSKDSAQGIECVGENREAINRSVI